MCSDAFGSEVTAFADAIRVPDSRGRELEVALVMHLQPFIAANDLTPAEVGRALIGSAANMLFAVAQSHDDALQGARRLADELVRRIKESPRR